MYLRNSYFFSKYFILFYFIDNKIGIHTYFDVDATKCHPNVDARISDIVGHKVDTHSNSII